MPRPILDLGAGRVKLWLRARRKRQWPSVQRDRASSPDRSGPRALPCTRSVRLLLLDRVVALRGGPENVQ